MYLTCVTNQLRLVAHFSRALDRVSHGVHLDTSPHVAVIDLWLAINQDRQEAGALDASWVYHTVNKCVYNMLVDIISEVPVLKLGCCL